MTEHYVTLFDNTFLPQGLALHASLLRHGGDCILWVLCLDQTCYETLSNLKLPQLRLMLLEQQESPELLEIKAGRSQREYCWTLTPWTIQWVLELAPDAKRVTYVDADVFLLSDPSPIWADFEATHKYILVTEHGYAADYDQTPTSGKYCVQFICVARGRAEEILHWWRDSCLEWCYSRFENGKFGDQKYIEDMVLHWPHLVHVSSNNLWFQAPWNSISMPFSKGILFHFHGLRIERRFILMWPGQYRIPSPTQRYVYWPYCEALVSLSQMHSIPLGEQTPLGSESTCTPPPSTTLRSQLRNLLKGPPPPPPVPENWYPLPNVQKQSS